MSGAVVLMATGGGRAFSVSVPVGVENVDAGSTVTTGVVTAVVTGGLGPFSYAWVADSIDAGVTIINPSAPSASFRATGLIPGEIKACLARCEVTDLTTGLQASSGTCLARMTRSEA